MSLTIRRTASAVLAGFAVLAAAGASQGAGPRDVEECAEAAVDGQTLQRQGRLIAAQARFERCAREGCRPDIVKDCAAWLREVTDATPSIVVAARDDSGTDRTDARLWIDDDPRTETDRARAIPLDPGSHVVRFEVPGAPPQSRTVVLREGDKRRAVDVVFPRALSSGAPTKEAERPRASTSTRTPTMAYVSGGVGLTALAVFGTFAIVGAVDRARSDCGSGCAAADAERVRTELLIADVGLGIGLAALAVTTVLMLKR
jgi:hypothetical protein